MPYCPQCRTEYMDFVDRCADCETTLVAELPPEETEATRLYEFVDVYATADILEAEAVRVLLEREELAILIKDMHISPFPVTINTSGQFRICVEQHHVLKAVSLIEEARKDEYISLQGQFLTAP